MTQSTIGSTICVSGWTKTIRPSTSYTNSLKTSQIAAYGYADTALADYEEDHLIPLELGGNPTAATNLWPEPRYVAGGKTAANKDAIENKLKKMVCAGTITLAAARSAIAKNWTTALTTVSASVVSASVSITNPGTQTAAVGSTTSLQVNAVDTAAGTLTFSATGLPAGLSISSATGLITGVPAAAASYSTTITAADSTGVSGSASFAWSVSASGTCSGAQHLGNPGFETGAASPWSATSGVISNDTAEPARSGDWDAWLDGYGTTHTDTVSQTVSLPSGCSASLTFYLSIDTDESGSTAYDTLSVKVLDSAGSTLRTLATYSNADAGADYAARTFSLAAYAGQTVTIQFTGTEDSSNTTDFVLDDTSLIA